MRWSGETSTQGHLVTSDNLLQQIEMPKSFTRGIIEDEEEEEDEEDFMLPKTGGKDHACPGAVLAEGLGPGAVAM